MTSNNYATCIYNLFNFVVNNVCTVYISIMLYYLYAFICFGRTSLCAYTQVIITKHYNYYAS